MRKFNLRYVFHGTQNAQAIMRDGLCLKPAAQLRKEGWVWHRRHLPKSGAAEWIVWSDEVLGWYKALPPPSKHSFRSITGGWNGPAELGRRIALLWVTTDFRVAANFGEKPRSDGGDVLVLDLDVIPCLGVMDDPVAPRSLVLILPPRCWQAGPEVVVDRIPFEWVDAGSVLVARARKAAMSGVWTKNERGEAVLLNRGE